MDPLIVALPLLGWWLLKKKKIGSNMATEHFSWSELTHSNTADRLGLSNEPDEAARANLLHLARNVLEPIRAAAGGRPMTIFTAYRSPAVNKAVGGATNSRHLRGLAADIQVDGLTFEHLQNVVWSIRGSIPLDEAILEYDSPHVHVAAAAPGESAQRDFMWQDANGRYYDWTPSTKTG